MKKEQDQNTFASIVIFGSSAQAKVVMDNLPRRAAFIHIPSKNTPKQRGAHVPRPFRDPSVCIDASHPCDLHTQTKAWRFARRFDLPLCYLDRPRWTVQSDEIEAANFDAAMAHIAKGARIFQATGFEDAHRAENYPDHSFWIRQIKRGRPSPYAHMQFVKANPPFSAEQERNVLTQLGCTHLILRNGGGTGAAPKLIAARELGLKIIFIGCTRPDFPSVLGKSRFCVARVTSPQEALLWAQAQEKVA